MLNTIVVATDLSKASDKVVGCLSGLKAFGTENVILVHALGLRYLKDMQPLLVRAAEPRLAEQKAMIESQGFSASIIVAPENAMFEVNRVALEHKASLIVIGSHGVTAASEVLLGGVAVAILHHARFPVMIARLKVSKDGQCAMTCTDFFARILYPTDFSDNAEEAFSYVEQAVNAGAKHITLMHVQDKAKLGSYLKDRLEDFNRIDQSRLDRIKSRLLACGAEDVKTSISYGSPFQEIIREARSGNYSLILMGSQGRGFIPEIFLGSVSHHVAHHSPVPVMVIPALRK